MSFGPTWRAIGPIWRCYNDREADWLELEKDTIELIPTRLTLLTDFIRFGSVCKTWHSIFLENRHRLPHQLPILIIPDDEKTDFRSFFSISENQNYRLKKLPHEDNKKRCYGSSDGCLVMIDIHLNISLLNPFSGAETPLPHLTTLSQIIDIHERDAGAIEYRYQMGHNCGLLLITGPGGKFVHKAITAGPYVVVLFTVGTGLAFCRRDDDKWSYVESDWSHLQDIMCYNGNFYVVTASGGVGILDVSGPNPTMTTINSIVERDQFYKKYLVESSGQLLMVATRFDFYKHKKSFEIFRVNMSKHQLFPLKALGDVMLFLGVNCSMSLSARDFTGCEGNRIYFIEVDKEWCDKRRLRAHNLVVYNVEDGSIETRYKMGLNWMWSQPTWLIPKPY